ncbi:MAG: aminotransferase, partial [Corynebacterium sp.]|nr:aminotransferase [Corynebacterium sp.]
MTSPKHRIFDQSDKLKGVAYDIRGEVSAEAERMELDGHTILKL